MQNLKILALETSCDETAVAIVENGSRVLANVIASQIDLHKLTGGVVPEVAAREHVLRMNPCLEQAFQQSGFQVSDIDLISVTQGPGLVGSLLIGVNAAKVLSFAWQKPLLGVNHVEGHIYANFLEREPDEIKFPLLVLTVSGGHNELILMKEHLGYELVGESLDDAAGEAFDKVSRILGLGYPGGPAIQKAAEKFQGKLSFNFPRAWGLKGHTEPSAKYGLEPKLHDFNFSFSGLKTAALQALPENLSVAKQAELAYAFQEAVVDALSVKTFQAALKYKVKEVHLAGGVSANLALRERLATLMAAQSINFKYPKNFAYCTDNAAMIGAAAYYRAQKHGLPTLEAWQEISVDPNLELKSSQGLAASN